jgi:hypothetical protein
VLINNLQSKFLLEEITMNEHEELIKLLGLTPHPEGGYFKEVYRSGEILPHSSIPIRYQTDRNISTSIYFMLCQNQISHFHRLQSDEVWHFYKGSSIILHCLDERGYSKMVIGNNIVAGEKPQYIIRNGTWFAAEVEDKSSYSLIGCTVAPGFDFADFELANGDSLVKIYPAYKDIILRLSIKSK